MSAPAIRMKVSEYRKRYFAEGSAPDTRTVIARIKRRELVGEKEGKLWYVYPKGRPEKRRYATRQLTPEDRVRRRPLVAYHAAKRRATKLQQTPAWADMSAIRRIYTEAYRIARKTGVPQHVDHIVPLQGKNVCGLHVENNLRIIPATDNIRKRNRFAE